MAERLGSRLANWSRSKMPTREDMERNRFIKPFAHRVLRSELWRFTRRSVPRGVALGLFAGFIVPVGQIFLAAFLALPARANVPLAAAVTFVTNPITFPFWAYLANRTGSVVLSIDEATTRTASHAMSSEPGNWLIVMFENAGVTVFVTVFGFVVLSVVMAAIGYLLSDWGWSWWIAHKRRTILRRRHEQLEKARRPDAGD